MSCSTPTNSILNRDAGDTALVSQVIYENESLKIQVETLQEKLKSTGLLKLDTLRQENETLRGEAATLRIQLEEKSRQLEQHRASGDRFSNIDQSLHELLRQIQTQRSEMTEMKDLTREKDGRILELTEQLKQTQEEAKEKEVQVTEAAASSNELAQQQSNAASAECGTLREQVAQLTAEIDTLRHASEEEAAQLQAKLHDAQEQLLVLKDEAAAKSVIKGARATSHEQEMAACREREASSQRQLVELQAKMEVLKTECSQLKDTNADLLRKQQHLQQQQQTAVAAATATAATSNKAIDFYSPEVRAHVEKAVRRATEGLERRLKEQVEQNATLLSRMALIQQESEAMMKSRGMSNHEVTVMKERVDMLSRRKEARNSMQRRVAELLSSEELSKEDIELLLQEMLDYQESQDQENRTLLLIKDIEFEERERTLRRELKRVKDENASLMKQLQQLAMEGFHRDRSSSLPNATEPPPREAEPLATGAPAAAAPVNPATPPVGAPVVNHLATAAEPYHRMPAPAYPTDMPTGGLNNNGGFTSGVPTGPPVPLPTAALPATTSAPSTQPLAPNRTGSPMQHVQTHQPRPQPQFGGDLWSNESSRHNTLHAQPQYGTLSSAGAAAAGQPTQPQYHNPHGPMAAAVSSPAHESNRNALVHCPVCTYEQRYANRTCEICEAVLQLR